MANKELKNVILAMAMAITAALAAHVDARTAPFDGDKGLNDQKNFLNYGGLGSFSGIGDNGLPFGGGGGLGGGSGLGGLGGGIGGLGGGGGGLGGLGGGIGGFGGGGIGAGVGGGVIGGIGGGGGFVKIP